MVHKNGFIKMLRLLEENHFNFKEIVKYLSQKQQLKYGTHLTNNLNQAIWQPQYGHIWGIEVLLNNSHIYAFQAESYYEASLCTASE